MDKKPPPPAAARTVGWIVDASADFLGRRGVESPRLAAEHLAARLLKCPRLDLHARRGFAMPPALVDAMRRGVTRVGSGEPLQHVLGQWGFRSLVLKTDRRALVPRPETEGLVQLLLDCAPLRAVREPRIIDYGTGSGCIALSIASEMPSAKLIGLDTSDDALALAQENAAALGLADRVAFLNPDTVDLADVLDPGSIDAVISNPPYIPTEACARLADNVRRFEPMAALDGGPDGMAVTRHVIEESTMLLASGGVVFLEIGAEDDQARPLGRYLADVGFENVRVHRDVFGKERFLSAVLAAGL
ncbi:MAG: peptide chain release factor N(5)-glutamine methyltransferase [Kiritimatiellia bacterium]|jgi:release factor glutamine methyltransferase